MKNDYLREQHQMENSTERFIRLNVIFSRFLQFLKPFLLPLLCGIFPPLFHYGNNITIILLPSLERMLLFNTVLVIVIYVIFYILLRGKSGEAAIATFILLIFFNTYGLVYNFFAELEIFRIAHYTLLPLYTLIGIYAGWLITKLPETFRVSFWKNTVLILSVLIVLNLGKIIPVEIAKSREAKKINPSTTANTTVGEDLDAGRQYPDIYFIMFDEFAGFQSMREYWKYNEVDEFVLFLKSQGFFIAEKSHGATIDTLQLMSSRLNFKDYPLGGDYRDTYYHDIANNKVMEYLKSLGYTTIVFDETRASFAYPAKTPINADYNLEYKPGASGDLGIIFDDYGTLVADNTMLLAFSKYYKVNNPVYQQHRGMILYTIENVASADISSPKFVYVHLMLPHMPFMFDENGNVTDPTHYKDWNSYLDNYKFAIRVAEKMVTNILAQADPNNPPIIILQSDHGARNKGTGNEIMRNFPEEFKTNIMFALYFPGYDTSTIPQDVNPVNTFPIIFNHLFNANIPLQ